MLLPEKMTKILIIGSKTRLEDSIDVLYKIEAVHPIDFSAEEEGFSLGAPLAEASEASQRLLRLRSFEKDLNVVDKPAAEMVDSSRIEREADEAINGLEAEITGIVESKSNIQNRIHELEANKKTLEPFLSLPLDIDSYKGYESLQVFTGMVQNDPKEVLRQALKEYELFQSAEGGFIAVFVAKAEAAEAQRVLIQQGFTEYPAPAGKGDPKAAMAAIDSEIGVQTKSLEEVAEKLVQLRKKHEHFILASDEFFSIEVEKAEFPLRVGTSDHAFVIDAWVPTKELPEVQKTIQEQLGDDVYVEVLETAPRRAHIHPEEAHAGVSEAHVVEVPPSKTSNRSPVNMFSFLTELISTPSYGEIDPTIIIAIFFPFFFGLMVGDIGYGIPFILLGILGLKKCASKEWRTIATMLFWGGIWATLLGLFLFGDLFGMPIGARWIAEPGYTLEQLKVMYPYGNELSWSSMTQTFLPNPGYLSKLNSVKLFLYITIWIGFLHLTIGYIVGIYNESIRHGFKHAFFHKVSWLMILVGGAFLLLYFVDLLILQSPVGLDDPRFLIGMVLIMPGIAISLVGEGATTILELPTVLSNVISYTRLAAIGMSKAGMALAFNMIAIEMIAPAGGFAIVAAMLVFFIGHLMIFILAVITAGIHGIRLHYVEQFQKFFSGGGLKFNPLKIVRKYTIER